MVYGFISPTGFKMLNPLVGLTTVKLFKCIPQQKKSVLQVLLYHLQKLNVREFVLKIIFTNQNSLNYNVTNLSNFIKLPKKLSSFDYKTRKFFAFLLYYARLNIQIYSSFKLIFLFIILDTLKLYAFNNITQIIFNNNIHKFF